jgi:voltage-gated sodium channel
MSSASTVRARVGAWIESTRVQKFIIALIIVNAAILGLETSAEMRARFGMLLMRLDQAILAVFVLEIAIKLYAHGWRFFRGAWNVFDLLVVGIALVPAAGPLSVLRSLRVLRVLRLISTMPRLRFIVESLLHAVPGIGAIGGLLGILFYVSAVMATSLFGGEFPEWFGSIGASLYSLFQIMTLESWSMGIVRPVMESFPAAWAFFVPFILLATFTMLNLFIAVIVNTMQTMHAQVAHDEREHIEEAVHDESTALRSEVSKLREELREIKALLLHGRQAAGPL